MVKAIYRLGRGHPELGIKANNFRDHIANLGQQLAPNFLDGVRGYTSDFFDERDGNRERCLSATHKQSLRNDQR